MFQELQLMINEHVVVDKKLSKMPSLNHPHLALLAIIEQR